MAHHWVHWVSAIIHSSDSNNAGSNVPILEKNCCYTPLKQKLGQLKCLCNDMGELMAALIKYADSDNTKDPRPDEEKSNKGKKNGNGKGQQPNMLGNNQGSNGKRKQPDGGSDFVANTNTQNNNRRRKGKPP